jgi:hypothetical protein
VREHRGADDALARRHRAPGRRSDALRQGRQRAAVDAALDAVQVAQAHHDFLKRRIAGALAEPVDGGAGMGRAGAERGQRVGGGQTEVVVRMDLDVEVGGATQLGDALVGAERVEDAQRVGIAHAHRTGGLRGLRHLRQEAAVGARRVFEADAGRQAGIARRADAALHHAEHPAAIAGQLALDLLIGHRHRQVHEVGGAVRGGPQVQLRHARPHHRACAQPGPRDLADQVDLGLAHRGGADLDLGHAGVVEGVRDRQLFVGGEHDTGGLLAIAQGRVVDGQ